MADESNIGACSCSEPADTLCILTPAGARPLGCSGAAQVRADLVYGLDTPCCLEKHDFQAAREHAAAGKAADSCLETVAESLPHS